MRAVEQQILKTFKSYISLKASTTIFGLRFFFPQKMILRYQKYKTKTIPSSQTNSQHKTSLLLNNPLQLRSFKQVLLHFKPIKKIFPFFRWKTHALPNLANENHEDICVSLIYVLFYYFNDILKGCISLRNIYCLGDLCTRFYCTAALDKNKCNE